MFVYGWRSLIEIVLMEAQEMLLYSSLKCTHSDTRKLHQDNILK